jgi:hypothetical protein
MHHHNGTNEKGKTVNSAKRPVKILSLRAGLFVAPRAFLRITGSSAPSVNASGRNLDFTRLFLALPLVLLAALAFSTQAHAEAPCSTCQPWWHLLSRVQPANIAPGGEGTIIVQGENLGDGATSGVVTLSDVLPPGFSVVEEAGVPKVEFFAFAFARGRDDLGPGSPFEGAKEDKFCAVAGSSVSCSTPGEGEFLYGPVGHLNPYENIEMRIRVKAEAAAVSAPNRTEVSGGGAAAVSARRSLQVGSGSAAFGVEDFSLIPEEVGGEVDTQAGSHPFQLTTTLTLNQNGDPLDPPALARNLQFNLPPGLVANTSAVPQCSSLDFTHVSEGGIVNLCPGDTAIGVVSITVDEPQNLGLVTFPVPLFNLAPNRGEPARFGFTVVNSPVILDTSIRTGSDYGATVRVSNITELAAFLSTTVTFWGVPGEPVHNSSRGWGCFDEGTWPEPQLEVPCLPSTESKPAPFLALPTACTADFEPSVEGLSWPSKAAPAGASFAAVPYQLTDGFGRMLGFSACNQLSFSPFIEVKPDVEAASSPSGVTVHVRVPQEVNENAAGLASSNVKDIAVTFPEGVTVNPAAADGLEACSEAQIGLLPGKGAQGELLFTADEPSCPDAAKIGTVSVKSPLLPKGQDVEGALYLATPSANGEPGMNPFNSLIATYIVAKDPISGVLLKLPGQVSLDPTTGRITATFDNNPQLAFEDAEIHLFGGSRAPFSTPALCRNNTPEHPGDYTTEAALTPWSGNPTVGSLSSFDITSGPNGTACPGGLPFAPTLAAGMTNINAGAFSPLTTTISREDGQQNIQTVQLHMPPGLSGILAGVPLCSEANANAGTCGQGSLIGHTVVSVGLGNEPFSVTGGKVFLTESYAGAPFGLSIVNPAVAGPFNLGKVIVRAKVEVDPHTAALTVTTGAIPHILEGIPLQIKHVNVTIDRAGFTFNPTNCNPQRITGSIGSVEGAAGGVEVPFQVTNCASLKFAPKFAVSTSGRPSRANGASLTAKLSYPKAQQDTYANIARVKVDLPKQLPSRLATLQKACTNTQFEADPANCPPASKIGMASVTTPLLPVPLTGPAIFVSHGGEAFPSLTMVLQGAPPYGVTVDLVGTTFISKAGITSTTFKTVPDLPFNTFQLTLPQGKFSALAANGNLCKSKLTMPTEFLAQNGQKISQSTRIAVTGCPKATKAKGKKKQIKYKTKSKGAK